MIYNLGESLFPADVISKAARSIALELSVQIGKRMEHGDDDGEKDRLHEEVIRVENF